MGDASSTTERRKQRTLFSDRTIQQALFDNGLKKYIILEGGNYGGAP